MDGGAAGLAEREEDCYGLHALQCRRRNDSGQPDVKLQCRGQNDSFQRDALLIQ